MTQAASAERLQFSGALPILAADAPRVTAHIRAVLANWPQTAPRPGESPTRITRQGDRYTVVSRWLDTPLEGLTDVGAACGAIVDTAQSFLDTRPNDLCLHSAAYEIAGRLVVLTGSAHAGKSTLAARMAAEEVLVYCDDMLPVTPDNHGLALGLPPRPRMPAPPSPALVRHIARHTAATDGKYCYLDTTHLAPHGRTAPIGVVILLDRRADGPAGFAPASRSQALRHLLLRNMARNQPMQAIADRLEAVLDTVPCITLHYSDLDEVAALLMAGFPAWPCDPDALLRNQPAPGRPLSDENPSRRRARPFDPDALVTRAPGIASRRVGDEIFLFDAGGTSVHSLNPLAAAIWTLLEEPASARAIAALLSEAFPETPRDTILTDTRILLTELAAHDAIAPAAPAA